jgi:CRP/FNR family cyclic AMP-dependent transcriptional regulator
VAQNIERHIKRKGKPDFDAEVFLSEAGKGRTLREYPRNHQIFLQGNPADSIFYVHKGKIKLTVVSKQGKEAMVAILGVSEFFGEGCLAGQTIRMATATTMSECSIMQLEKAGVVRLLKDQPVFSELLLHHLLSRNIRIEEDLVDHLFNSSEKRLARVLLLLANFGKDSKPEPVIAKISQETLAEIVGTTRSRVSFFMNRFRKLVSSSATAACRFTRLCSMSSCTTDDSRQCSLSSRNVSIFEQIIQVESPIIWQSQSYSAA